jgi:cholesterol oxidase
MPEDQMLSKDWGRRRQRYDFVVVGSGYGGAISAARISGEVSKPTVCLLERGREWIPGEFPSRLNEILAAARNPLLNPLGLYEFLAFPDISILKGSGLGGTSLINANVAIVPDAEVFAQASWPRTITLQELLPHYDRARQMLAARPHPRSNPDSPDCLKKVGALDKRARETGRRAFGLDLAVNFDIDGLNPHGRLQTPCIDCGDCVTGCNTGAKNTLYMNYLPAAHRNGTDIFTRMQVDWLERLPGGGWRVHGKRFLQLGAPEKFTLDAGNVILSAGSLGTVEILLKSETHGLSVSPKLGTQFSGNGDFFALAYNTDHQINTLGFGANPSHPWRTQGNAPGPSIVGCIRYDSSLPLDQRIAVEDFSFPSAYVGSAMLAFGSVAALGGAEDMDAGDEQEEAERRRRDNAFDVYNEHNALNHTLLYLIMGRDDARGTLHLKSDFLEQDEHVAVDWDDVGRQPVFTLINEEIRRHARSLGGSFMTNPLWNFVSRRNLITAHPIGGCPLGEDYMQGAADEFGRVFAGDGSIHPGLFVADGSLVPSALGVNPFLTISALSERIADRLVRSIGGEAYPERPVRAAVPGLDPVEVSRYKEADLERIFSRVESLGIESIVNGGDVSIDAGRGIITNDTCWKGFFPRRHILNQFSTAFLTGFKKRFTRSASGIEGETSDSDGRIRARNTLEEIKVSDRTGTLEPGRYILLRYPDDPWRGFYDIFKIVSHDLLIGRVCLGEFPNGVRMFTFPMTRAYSLDDATVADHRRLYEGAQAPSKEQLAGLWEMRMVSNAADTGVVAYLDFELKPDGRLESRYQLFGLLEGMAEPVFARDHFQLNDFTPFHDEIRAVGADFMVGKYTTSSPPGLAQLFGPGSLGLFQFEAGPGGAQQFSFYYTLRRSRPGASPVSPFLAPLLDVRLPAGLGMTFDEEMTGHYFPGFAPQQGNDGDAEIEARASGPEAKQPCSFQARMTVRDLNEFFESPEHEAAIQGTIDFGDFGGQGPATFEINQRKSRFNYLRINPATGEAEMLYNIYFRDSAQKEYLFYGRKYMRKNGPGGITGISEVLQDYTTLYCRVSEAASGTVLGSGLLKFRTFEDLDAAGSFAAFLSSFQVTGTDNALLKARGLLRFMALTNRFVMREYDPLSVRGGFAAQEVREALLRGAETRDYFSTRPSPELQAVMRETPTRPLETLINRGTVQIDYANRRILRDSFWKGSFAQDSLLGWEERLRGAALTLGTKPAADRYTGGSFWKRFDEISDGILSGYVVNYEVEFLPGMPMVSRVRYPDDNRRFVKAGDDVLLLTYTNEPYRMVYDVIKAVGENDCIGVMHLGTFPAGVEFATFVMARHNYPFEKMSVPDHRAMFSGEHARIPTAAEMAGEWQGHVVFLTRPDMSLLNQVNPVAIGIRFLPTASGAEARCRFGLGPGTGQPLWSDEFARLMAAAGISEEVRIIDGQTLLWRLVCVPSAPWLQQPATAAALRGYLEPTQSSIILNCVLSRV